MNIRKFAKTILPPVLTSSIRKSFGAPKGFSAPYPNFAAARNACRGYAEDSIAETVAAAVSKVLRGEARFERDGATFDEIQYSWPLLAGLMWVAAREGRLRVCDVGGALGSTYLQNRIFLAGVETTYAVVEQPNFVRCGRSLFDRSQVRFYEDLEDCIADGPIDVLVLSGVLPYLEDPRASLDLFMSKGFRYIIIDRTPLLTEAEDRITVQRVPRSLYNAAYPAWFINDQKLVEQIDPLYKIVERFDSFESWDLGDVTAQARGFILEHRRNNGFAPKSGPRRGGAGLERALENV
jgi:putative methyltransferase (TIGR04325 family)